MKTYTYSLILAAAASGMAFGAQTAYTIPVGYTTQTLNPSSFNLVGLPLTPSAIVAGNFETVAGTVLTDAGVTITPTAGRTYILKITSGVAAVNGVIQEIPAASISGGTITTPQNLGALGLVAGDTYSLRLAPTIEEIIGTTTSAISKGPTAGSSLSDIIWVPGLPGVYTRYYIRSSDSTVRNASSNAAALNVPLVNIDGIFIEKKATGTASLVVSGEVPTKQVTIAISQGFNLIGTVYPVGTTLQNFGLDVAPNNISKGPTAGSTLSDIVSVPTGPGTYNRFYLRSSDSTWRNATTNAAAPADLALPTSVLIERKPASAVNLKALPPSSYSSL